MASGAIYDADDSAVSVWVTDSTTNCKQGQSAAYFACVLSLENRLCITIRRLTRVAPASREGQFLSN